MKKRSILIITASTFLLAGCLVTSVYPYYQEKDVAFEPALLGHWTNPEEAGELWVFEKGNTNAYRLSYIQKATTNVMRATFFRLRGTEFLDLSSSEMKDEIQPPPIPSHFLFRISQTKPTIKMSALDYDWLAKLLSANPAALRHHLAPTGDEPEKKRVVLTADTLELQKFILKHLADSNAWQEPIELQSR